MIRPAAEGLDQAGERFPDLLRDESNLAAGRATRVYLPSSAEEVADVVAEAARTGATITVSGARTGISGGAVPVQGEGDGAAAGGHVGGVTGEHWVMSLQKLQRLHPPRVDPDSGEVTVRVEAGVSLDHLARNLEGVRSDSGARLVYPVDPTEWSASVGGTVATNASGGRSFRYGPTGSWVRGLTLVLADGRRVDLRRGEVHAGRDAVFWPHAPGAAPIPVPRIPRPRSRCVAGYDLAPGGDLLDLFIGSEGTLGVVVEAELALTPAPSVELGIVGFLPAGVDVVALVSDLREDSRLPAMAIEFMDAASLRLLREERSQGRGGIIPELPASAHSALFLELGFDDEAEVDTALEGLDEVLARRGASMDDTWAGDDAAERRKLRALRHAVPEAVNARITRYRRTVPSLHKVGTDLAVPDEAAAKMYGLYEQVRDASGLESVLFGHAAENHLHLNFLPRTEGELEQARALHLELAREAVRLGGSVTAEHGVGRLKRPLVPIQYGDEGVRELRRIKDVLDPRGTLNPGVLLPSRPTVSTAPER